MEFSPRSILEPIDPLNISFAADKCVKTPETNRTSEACSSIKKSHLAKNLNYVFDENRYLVKNKSFSTPKRPQHEPYYDPRKRYSVLEKKNYDAHNYLRKSEKVGSINFERRERHVEQIKKIDKLLDKINIRLEISKKLSYI